MVVQRDFRAGCFGRRRPLDQMTIRPTRSTNQNAAMMPVA